MIFVDTGYLVALADQRDQHNTAAVAWSRASGGLFLVTECVLLETINILSPPGFRAAAHELATAVRSGDPFEFVPASTALLNAGISLHFQYRDKAWSLTDCISFHLMRERGITDALAYDQHFQQAGFVAPMRGDPP